MPEAHGGAAPVPNLQGSWVPGSASRPRNDEGGRTHDTAPVRHWTAADRGAHEEMGFHAGWGQCAGQLAALVATL